MNQTNSNYDRWSTTNSKRLDMYVSVPWNLLRQVKNRAFHRAFHRTFHRAFHRVFLVEIALCTSTFGRSLFSFSILLAHCHSPALNLPLWPLLIDPGTS